MTAPLLFVVTMYCPGPTGTALTASGTHPRQGRTVATDPLVLPPGTPLLIHGLGPYVAEDTGRLVTGRSVDVFVEDCKEARAWGRRARLVRRLPRPVSASEWDELKAGVARVRAEASAPVPEIGGKPTSAADMTGRGSTLPLALSLLGSFAALTLWAVATVARLFFA